MSDSGMAQVYIQRADNVQDSSRISKIFQNVYVRHLKNEAISAGSAVSSPNIKRPNNIRENSIKKNYFKVLRSEVPKSSKLCENT